MVNDSLIIDKLGGVFGDIVAEKGGVVYLFMVIKMDEFADKWSLMFSASWVNNENLREVFSYLSQKLAVSLSDEENKTFARIGVFTPDEHFVGLVTGVVRVNDGEPVRIQQVQINGNFVHDGWVYRAIPYQVG